jgi:hypothetical protein
MCIKERGFQTLQEMHILSLIWLYAGPSPTHIGYEVALSYPPCVYFSVPLCHVIGCPNRWGLSRLYHYQRLCERNVYKTEQKYM